MNWTSLTNDELLRRAQEYRVPPEALWEEVLERFENLEDVEETIADEGLKR